MKFYATANKPFSNEPGIRCFLTYAEAEKAGEGNEVYEFEAELSSLVVREGAFEKNYGANFVDSEKKATEYKLGTFIRPVYFAKDVDADRVFKKSGGENGNPMFFESNDKYYTECLFEKLKEKYPNFELYAVRSCLEAFVKSGKMRRTENEEFVIFEDPATGELIPVCKRYTK